MLLEVRDFMSIRYARLETDANHAVIAGRNGCGKSQFLAAFAAHWGWGTVPPEAQVTAQPYPTSVVYYRGQRDISREWNPNPMPDGGPLPTYWGDPVGMPGREGVSVLDHDAWQARFCSSYFHWVLQSRDDAEAHWDAYSEAFLRLTGRTLRPRDDGSPAIIAPGHSSPMGFEEWSSGEQETASLLLDASLLSTGGLLIVDELESHLHPALQAALVSELTKLVPRDAFLLVSTHSAAVLLTAGVRSSFWMEDAVTADGANQLRPVGGDVTLTRRVFDLYAGCSTAEVVPEILVLAQGEAFGSFLDQCYELPGVEPYEAGEDSDPQVAEIRTSVAAAMQRRDGLFRFVDFGCGKGRCLRAFKGFPPEQRGRLAIHLIDRDPANLAEAVTHVPAGEHFAGVHTHRSIDEVEMADYVAAANVFHEVVGESFSPVFGAIWNRLLRGGTLHILEMGELLVGEKGFLTICEDGYRTFLQALPNAAPFVLSHLSHGGLGLIAAQAKRTDGKRVSAKGIREAYVAALRVTKSHCHEMLSGDLCGSRRAFWLENLASVDRTLEEMGGSNGEGRPEEGG